ncbi:MAG: flagellar basal body rod C-terminal domain-containing protein [Desulfohalobiaceae bacterium]
MNSISGMGAFESYGLRQQVSANNVANMNTQDFQPSRVELEEVGNRQGVAAQSVEKTGSQQMQGMDKAAGQDQAEGQEAGNPSGTDLADEMVNQLENRTAYSANANSVSTQSEMQGQLLNRMA